MKGAAEAAENEMLKRRESREVVFGLVYELEFNREYNTQEIFDNAIKEREARGDRLSYCREE